MDTPYLAILPGTCIFHLGICPYKFLYVWLDLILDERAKLRDLGWFYWLLNPLFPYVVFRIGLPRNHRELQVEEFRKKGSFKVRGGKWYDSLCASKTYGKHLGK